MEKPNERKKDIIIDYENFDVRDIMDQIKKKIASQQEKSKSGRKVQGGGAPPSWEPLEEAGEMEGLKGKLKELLIRGIRPFSPLIKLLVLPVHQEVREAHQNLYHAHKRLDNLERMSSNLEQRIDEVQRSTHQRLDELSAQLKRTQEYVKLLHNLSHNMVVELSKLKIEEENMKIKNRILEKDFEFLGKREKALERKIYK